MKDIFGDPIEVGDLVLAIGVAARGRLSANEPRYRYTSLDTISDPINRNLYDKRSNLCRVESYTESGNMRVSWFNLDTLNIDETIKSTTAGDTTTYIKAHGDLGKHIFSKLENRREVLKREFPAMFLTERS